MDQQTPKRPGRPATGQTPKRNVRIGATWDRAEELALEIARRDGNVRLVRDRATGETTEAGNITAYVEEALREHNARVERRLSRP